MTTDQDSKRYSLQRRHFVAIAQRLNIEYAAANTVSQQSTVLACASQVATALGQFSPKFRRDLFIATVKGS